MTEGTMGSKLYKVLHGDAVQPSSEFVWPLTRYISIIGHQDVRKRGTAPLLLKPLTYECPFVRGGASAQPAN